MTKQQFIEALDCVEDKEYVKAFRIFSDLSNEGLAEAQFNLSLLYFLCPGFRAILVLYWAWMSHLNLHESALNREC